MMIATASPTKSIETCPDRHPETLFVVGADGSEHCGLDAAIASTTAAVPSSLPSSTTKTS